MWLEDVLLGALSDGVNKPTLILLNVVLTACALTLLGLLYAVGGSSPDLLLHLGAVLLLAVGLTASINWLVIQTGTTAVEEQRKAIFGEGDAREKPE
ncbi:hypothetical protein ACKKBG_A02855 [Auxenochlorella protothecoides x Auxenochlorella symbiontica]|uniref:Transmembrane protein n=1 Tax=Auxenochlorella protothecoides TaxID=3075 RepID=A0A087SM83_AUXPR|nr:hypothetical protein F751_0769 [Auxenochlorella protothecoides]KFM26837.1 hypothetical protein F751_0769 [Auxenochlorella protothecoides]